MENIERTTGEIEQFDKPEGWFIDDEEALEVAYGKALGRELGETFNLKYYQIAEDAVAVLTECLENNKPIPAFIFLDYELRQDRDEFRDGANVTRMIVELCKKYHREKPLLIAASWDIHFNSSMIAQGADESFERKEFFEAVKFVSEYFAKKDHDG